MSKFSNFYSFQFSMSHNMRSQFIFICYSGEKVSQVTKNVQKENAVRCLDKTKKKGATSGRRIDLLLGAADGLELSSSERKKDKASYNTSMEQQEDCSHAKSITLKWVLR